MQRENPAVHGGRESRQHRQLFAPAGRSRTQPRRHDRPHVGTIGQSRDSDPTLAGYPLRERRGYRHKTTRYLRIPHGIGVTGAWHSLHSSVCERKFPTLPPSGGVGSRAVYRAEDVTGPRWRSVTGRQFSKAAPTSTSWVSSSVAVNSSRVSNPNCRAKMRYGNCLIRVLYRVVVSL